MTTCRTGPERVALAILTLTAAGEPVPDRLLALLAEGVLAAPLPALALRVQAGGPHRLRQALDLAELVLRSDRSIDREVG